MNPLTKEVSRSLSDWSVCHYSCLMMDYRTNQEMQEDVLELAEMFPSIAVPFVIGQDVYEFYFYLLAFYQVCPQN